MDYLKELEGKLPELQKNLIIRFDAGTTSIPYATKGTVECNDSEAKGELYQSRRKKTVATCVATVFFKIIT